MIANADDADPGFVGHELRRRGFALTEGHRERPTEWPALAGFDLLLSLGSEWSVYWPHVERFVAAETALIRCAHDGGVPLLGICFGNQLMAQALGGSVAAAPRPEIGWIEIETDDARAIPTGPWLQWHGDVVTVPPGAVELARNPVGPQAWRLGRSLATQFHPEATETMLARWSATGGAELAAVGLTPESMMEATRANVEAGAARTARLVSWFCDEFVGAE